MHRLAVRTLLSLILGMTSLSVAAQAISAGGGWIDTPEAYFAVGEEIQEWVQLKSEADKQAFIERYWLRRDPTPGTPRNEFRDTVMGRIKTADEKFAIDTTMGSTTARGMVFILFGSPAAVREQNSGVPSRTGAGGEWSQVLQTWRYDRFRTKAFVDLIGRPELEVKFLITPSEKRDQLQDEGVISPYRKVVAEASIVTKDVVAGPTGPRSMVDAVDFNVAPLPEVAIRELNAAADAPSALKSGTFFGADGKPVTMFTLSVPASRTPTGPATLFGRISDAQQQVVATVAKDMRSAEGFTVRGTDVIYAVMVPLPPGTYEATFALHAGANAIASGLQRVVVPAMGSGLDVSSLVLTNDLMSTEPPAIVLGGAPVRPRADGVFGTNESLWYAFQVASATDPGNVGVQLVLRRTGGKSSTHALSTGLTQTAPGSWIGGFEMPLQTLEPGDYSLYLTLSDAAGHKQVRRADFKIVAAQ